MTQVYFICSNAKQMLPSCVRTEVDGMQEAKERAATIVRSLLARPGPEDWRSWVLHARDDLGEEIFALPFSSVMGRLH
jgi:hypothetical protein